MKHAKAFSELNRAKHPVFHGVPDGNTGPIRCRQAFKTNCALCHSADGSGDSATGKALHAKDLRSDEVQKQSDAALNEVITKGRGKMPAFGAKIKPDDIHEAW